MTLVSIIIRVSDRYNFIQEAISSCIVQDYTPIEIIIVDDSKNPCNDAFNKSSVKYFSIPNNGRSYSLNFGIMKSQGQYILFLDDDDILEPNMISSCIRKINLQKVDIVHVGFLYFTGEKPAAIPSSAFYKPTTVDFKSMLRQNYWPINSILIRKDLITKAGGADPQMQTCEDWDLWLRVLYAKPTISYLNRYLVWIRIHKSNTSRNRYEMFFGHYKILTKWKNALSKTENNDIKINSKIALAGYKVGWYGIIEDPTHESIYRKFLLKPIFIYPLFFLLSIVIYILSFFPKYFLRFLTAKIEKVLQKQSLYQLCK